ncbi:hypothetical protein F4604DRAFT_1682723 [Suillus subluteus]|nr:hypothetical protein F4604DRAFT_1682723 [Suillus subluteus]
MPITTKGTPKTTNPTVPATRSSSRLTVNEIIASNSEVKDAVSVKTHLTQTAMAISGKPFSTDKLSDILFHITQLPGITLPIQNAIRAVAFLLEEAAEIETADKITKLFLTAILPQIAKIQDTSEGISATVLELKNIKMDSLLAPGKSSHTQLLESIKKVICTITKPESPKLEVRAVNQFCNGGTIIEMVTENRASYLKQENIKTEFIKALDPTASIKD